MNRNIKQTVRRFCMLQNGDAVVVGVSGGADSMALLHLLCGLREELNLQICAAHVNHGLRGDEALRDEEFVKNACAALGVPFYLRRARVFDEAKAAGETVEEAGRRVRYAFFEEVARPLSAKIATAHTLSDSMETMLLNLARGTGLKGLCGIPPKRGRIIRPLIECTRAQVEEYCRSEGISYVTDSTNLSTDYTRNRIRLTVVPRLYEVNPAFDRAALRAQRAFAEDERELTRQAEEALRLCEISESRYRAGPLCALPGAVQSRALAQAARAGTGVSQEAVHIDEMRALLARGSGRVQLKGGGFAVLRRGELVFSLPEPAGVSRDAREFCVPFAPGTFENGRFRMKIIALSQFDDKNFKNIHKQYFNNAIDCDKIIGKAVIRSRRPGDRFTPAGRGVRKTLKKLCNEAAVPPRDRNFLPVVADEAGILWVCGFGPDERCGVSQQSERAFLIEITNPGGSYFDK